MYAPAWWPSTFFRKKSKIVNVKLETMILCYRTARSNFKKLLQILSSQTPAHRTFSSATRWGTTQLNKDCRFTVFSRIVYLLFSFSISKSLIHDVCGASRHYKSQLSYVVKPYFCKLTKGEEVNIFFFCPAQLFACILRVLILCRNCFGISQCGTWYNIVSTEFDFLVLSHWPAGNQTWPVLLSPCIVRQAGQTLKMWRRKAISIASRAVEAALFELS